MSERTGDGADAGVKRTHEEFNASDSDVTIESADGVQFRLHTQNLKVCTGAFPGSVFATQGSPTPLTENADVLEIVFAYIYPRRYPSLDGIEFTLLAKVAEAVEKYEVSHAMNVCAIRMMEFLPQYAGDILAHGVKHGYPKLINEGALALSRSYPMSDFITKLSLTAVQAWIRYSESWKAIFEGAFANIESSPMRSETQCQSQFSQTQNSRIVQSVCKTCRLSLITWVTKTEKIASLSSLKTSLTPLMLQNYPGFVYCHANIECRSGECMYMKVVAQIIQDGIANIPPFEQYLNGTK